MANVRSFTMRDIDRVTAHTDVDATLSLVQVGTERFVQIDMYGSVDRKTPNKVSQSLRLSKAAFDELVTIASCYF